jgi:hypothetical protein
MSGFKKSVVGESLETLRETLYWSDTSRDPVIGPSDRVLWLWVKHGWSNDTVFEDQLAVGRRTLHFWNGWDQTFETLRLPRDVRDPCPDVMGPTVGGESPGAQQDIMSHPHTQIHTAHTHTHRLEFSLPHSITGRPPCTVDRSCESRW